MHFLISILRDPDNAIPRNFDFLDTTVVRRIIGVTALLAITGTLAAIITLTSLGLVVYMVVNATTAYTMQFGGLVILLALLMIVSEKLADSLEYLYAFQQGLTSGREFANQREEERHQKRLEKRRHNYHAAKS